MTHPIPDTVSAAATAVGGRNQPPTNPCHHCAEPATGQWQRAATAEEHEAHWAAVERNIRDSNSGTPDVEYTAARTAEVRKAVFGCDNHPDPAPGLLHAADCGGHGSCQCVSPEAPGVSLTG